MLRKVAALGLMAAASSCVSEETTEDPSTVTTAVVVDPAQFLGSFPCGVPGGPQSYVATIIDLGSAAEEGAQSEGGGGNNEALGPIATSSRVDCSTPLAFTNVVAGHRYSATVEVFDVPADEPAEAPAWATACGEDFFEAAVAESLQQIVVRSCTPLSGPGTGATGISIDPDSTIGSLGCTDDDDGGLVYTIEVIPSGVDYPLPDDVFPMQPPALPSVTRSCGQEPIVFSGDDILPGAEYTFRIEGEDFPFEQLWVANCRVKAREGLEMPAVCTTMTDRGALVFPLSTMLDEASVSCGDGVTRARLALPAGPSNLAPTVVPCDQDVTIDDLLRGSYVGSVELLDGPATVAIFSCTGAVDPTGITELSCALED